MSGLLATSIALTRIVRGKSSSRYSAATGRDEHEVISTTLEPMPTDKLGIARPLSPRQITVVLAEINGFIAQAYGSALREVRLIGVTCSVQTASDSST